MGKTALPETQHVGEAYTALEINIAGESWLAEEEVVQAQVVDVELDLTWGHLEDSIGDAHVPFVSAEPDPLLGELDSLEDNAHAHLESTELEILTNTEVNWLEEVEEEETAKVMAVVDGPRVDLQGLGVSNLTMLKGMNTLTFPSLESSYQPILLRIEHLLRLLATETGMWATRESRHHTDLELLPLNLPPPNGDAEPPDNTVPKQIQAPTKVERLLELF